MNREFVPDMNPPGLCKPAEHPETVRIIGIKIRALCGQRDRHRSLILKIAVHFRGVICFIGLSENFCPQLCIPDAADFCNFVTLFFAETGAVDPAVREIRIAFKIGAGLVSADDIGLKTRIAPHGDQRKQQDREKLCKIRLDVTEHFSFEHRYTSHHSMSFTESG